MGAFDQLVKYVQENYPDYAYVLRPDVEIAVDGLIFRPLSSDRNMLNYVGEGGEEMIDLDSAIQLLSEDRIGE